MKETTKKLDIVEFLRTIRSLKSQVEIVKGLAISEEEKQLVEKSLARVSMSLQDYLEGDG